MTGGRASSGGITTTTGSASAAHVVVDARPLSVRQRQVLVALLVGWWHGRIPSFRELVSRLGISCTSHVSAVLQALQLRGLVEGPTLGRSRMARVTPAGVRAGLQLATEDELERMLVEVGERFTALRAEVAHRSRRPVATLDDARVALEHTLEASGTARACDVQAGAGGLLVVVRAPSRFDEVCQAVPAFVAGFPATVALEGDHRS